MEDRGYPAKCCDTIEKFLNILVIARNSPFVYLSNHPKQAKIVLSCTIFILYNIYFTFALTHRADENLEWEFCDGHGFLVIVTAITYIGLFYYLIFIPCFGEKLYQLFKPLGKFFSYRFCLQTNSCVQYFDYVLLIYMIILCYFHEYYHIASIKSIKPA